MEGLDMSKVPFDLIMNILNIVLLFIIVRFLVYKPVRKFLDARKSRLEAEKAGAVELREEADRLKAEYESRLTDSQAEAHAMMRKCEEEARIKADAIVASAKADADRIVDDAEKKIAAKERESVAVMKSDLVDLSLSIAEKVVGRSMTDEDNRRLADEFFDSESEKIR